MSTNELVLRIGQQGAQEVQTALTGLRTALQALLSDVQKFAGANLGAEITKVGAAFRSGAEAAQSMGGVVQLLAGGLEAMATPLGLAVTSMGALYETMNKATGAAEAVFREVRNLEGVTGQGATESKALADAFNLMGLESEGLTRAMFRLSAEIESGGKRLAALGISALDAQGNLRPTGEVFIDIIEKLEKMNDVAARTTALRQLFGRQGVQLAAMFASGKHSIEEWIAAAKEAGVYSEEDQARTEQLVQVKAKLAKQMEELWLKIAKAAIPIAEAIAKAVGFFVEGLSSMIGLVIEGVRTFPEWSKGVAELEIAFTLLSIPVKIVAASFKLIGELGKAIADALAPPPGAETRWQMIARHASNIAKIVGLASGEVEGAPKGPEALKKKGPEGPIETAEDIAFQGKLNEERLKLEARYNQELHLMETGSHTESLKEQQEFLAQTLRLEEQKIAAMKEKTPKENIEAQKKLDHELQLRRVQIEGETKLLTLKIKESETADARKALEDQLKARKDAADEEVKLIQLRRDEDLEALDRVGVTVRERVEGRKDVEINAARDTAAAKQALIAEEVQRLKTLAAAYQDNAALQRDVTNRLIALAHERASVEIDETRAVDRAKAEASKADEARKDKEAGMFGQMIKLAEDYAKQQGRTVISQQDITAATEQMAQTSQQTLAGFFGGAAIDPKKLEQAWQFTQQQRQMQKEGVTPEGVTSAAFGQAGQTYGAGFGYDAAIAAFSGGNIGLGQQLQARAGLQAAAQGIPPDLAVQLRAGIDPKLNDLKGQLATTLDQVTDKWGELVKTIPDKLIRWLEAEAARN